MMVILRSRSILLLACLVSLLAVVPAAAQNYYEDLPDGIENASVDGSSLRPGAKTSSGNDRPTVTGVISTGASSVEVRIGSLTTTATTSADGSFSVTVGSPLAAGEHDVYFDGSLVGTIVISSTPVAPETGTGASITSPNDVSPVLLVGILSILAGAGIIGGYALANRRTIR